MRILRSSVSLAAMFVAANAFAQSAILGAGPMANGHVPVFTPGGFGQPIVKDAGGSGGGPVGTNPNELGITSVDPMGVYPSANSGHGPLGEHQCMFDAPTTNPTGFHYLCFDPNAQGGGLIDYGAGGGATQLPLQISINGVLTSLTATTPSVANLAALRALSPGQSTFALRLGYVAVGDAPPLLFSWRASCPGTPDNLGLYVAPNAGGTGCWSAAADPNRFDTREWGAVNDSTALTCGTDNAAAFQAAVNALGAGARIYNAGPSCIKSQIAIAQPGQRIACLGGGNAGGLHDVGAEFTAPAPIVWGGSVGGTMFKYQSATTQASNGWGGDCALNGLGVAAYGVNSVASRGGVWDVYGAHFTGSIVRADVDATLGDSGGSSYNTYTIFVDQRGNGDGAAFQCFGTAAKDCSQDQFPLITGVWNGQTPAVDFDGADTEHVGHLSLYNSNVVAGVCGIRFRAGATWVQTGRNNFVDYAGVASGTNNACAVNAEGTEAGGGRVVASNWNSVGAVDTATGGATVVHIGTPGGSLPGGTAIAAYNMLWWGINAAPPGLNYFSQSGGTYSERTAWGVVTNRGASTTITHGTSLEIDFTAAWSNAPTAAGTQIVIPTACQSVALIPNQAVPFHAACAPGSPTKLTIFNDSGSTDAAFFYEVRGY